MGAGVCLGSSSALCCDLGQNFCPGPFFARPARQWPMLGLPEKLLMRRLRLLHCRIAAGLRVMLGECSEQGIFGQTAIPTRVIECLGLLQAMFKIVTR